MLRPRESNNRVPQSKGHPSELKVRMNREKYRNSFNLVVQFRQRSKFTLLLLLYVQNSDNPLIYSKTFWGSGSGLCIFYTLVVVKTGSKIKLRDGVKQEKEETRTVTKPLLRTSYVKPQNPLGILFETSFTSQLLCSTISSLIRSLSSSLWSRWRTYDTLKLL